eukprot:680138-Pelagomonas_calceolata.AAC.6
MPSGLAYFQIVLPEVEHDHGSESGGTATRHGGHAATKGCARLCMSAGKLPAFWGSLRGSGKRQGQSMLGVFICASA